MDPHGRREKVFLESLMLFDLPQFHSVLTKNESVKHPIITDDL